RIVMRDQHQRAVTGPDVDDEVLPRPFERGKPMAAERYAAAPEIAGDGGLALDVRAADEESCQRERRVRPPEHVMQRCDGGRRVTMVGPERKPEPVVDARADEETEILKRHEERGSAVTRPTG